jgi:transcription initiation factor TFIID TATA-box-binding protein
MPVKKKKKKKKPKKDEIDFIALDINAGNAQQAPFDVPPYELVNVVSTCSLGVENIDLRKLALEKNFLEFNPLTFAAATFRIRSPRTTCLLFASGNMVITGSSNEHESRLAARKYCAVLQKCKLRVMFKDFGIQNIVASANVKFTINLQDIADEYSSYASYDPDLFPGLVFRSVQPKLVFLIFRSGKIVITGAKKNEEIAVTYNSLYRNIIIKHRGEEGSTASSSEYRNQILHKKMELPMQY